MLPFLSLKYYYNLGRFPLSSVLRDVSRGDKVIETERQKRRQHDRRKEDRDCLRERKEARLIQQKARLC